MANDSKPATVPRIIRGPGRYGHWKAGERAEIPATWFDPTSPDYDRNLESLTLAVEDHEAHEAAKMAAKTQPARPSIGEIAAQHFEAARAQLDARKKADKAARDAEAEKAAEVGQ